MKKGMRSYMKWMKKIASGALALLLAGSLTACGGDTSWAYRSGDDTVTSGMYIGLSINALNTAYSLEGFDNTKTPFQQKLEGEDAVQWLKEKTEELAREYLAVEQKFDEMGLTLAENEVNGVSATVELYWTTLGMGTSYTDAGCGKESFTKIYTNSAKRGRLFQTIYGEGGEKEVPESELKTIFANDYAKGTYFTVSLTDEDGNALTGADLIDKKEEAQKLADRIAGGEDIEEVKAEYNGTDKSDDSSVVIQRSNENLTAGGTAIVKGKAGESGMVTDDKYAYVYLVQDPLSGDTFENYRSTVLQNLKGDEFNETVAEWAAAVTLEENAASLRKHSPKHLKSLL